MSDKNSALVESIDEVLESAEAVKGPAFANLLKGIFAQLQVIDALGVITVAAERQGASIGETCKDVSGVAASALVYLTMGHPQELVEEAMALAGTLMERRNAHMRDMQPAAARGQG